MPIKSKKRMSSEKEDAEHQQRDSADHDQQGEEEITKVLKYSRRIADTMHPGCHKCPSLEGEVCSNGPPLDIQL
jgi:hypothetical protein